MENEDPTIHVTINGQEMDLTEKESEDLLASLTRYLEQQQKKQSTDTLSQNVDAYVKARETSNA